MNPDPDILTSTVPRIPITLIEGILPDPTPLQIFSLIRDIIDPEHPYSLESLHVVDPSWIEIFIDNYSSEISTVTSEIYSKGTFKIIKVYYQPTVFHCSMANLIGLCIKLQVLKYASKDVLVIVNVRSNGHSQEFELNKQLNDKDRVYAAMESESLMQLVNELLPEIK